MSKLNKWTMNSIVYTLKFEYYVHALIFKNYCSQLWQWVSCDDSDHANSVTWACVIYGNIYILYIYTYNDIYIYHDNVFMKLSIIMWSQFHV